MDGVDEGKKKEQISSICQVVGGTGHFAFTTSSHVICLSPFRVSPVILGRRFISFFKSDFYFVFKDGKPHPFPY